MNEIVYEIFVLMLLIYKNNFVVCSTIGIFVESTENRINNSILPDEIVLPSYPNVTLKVTTHYLNSNNLCECKDQIKRDTDNDRILNIFLGEFKDLNCLDTLLERNKAFAFMVNTKDDRICYRNIIFGYNFTDPAIKSINVFIN